MWAVRNAHIGAAAWLVAHGVRKAMGVAALSFAAPPSNSSRCFNSNGEGVSVKCCARHQAKVDAVTKSGTNLLHWAIWSAILETVNPLTPSLHPC